MSKEQNTHIKHFEELLFDGEEGLSNIEKLLSCIRDEINGINSNLKISTKIDGAPAMFVWKTFPNLHPNGVATKTVFNKIPITCHTSEDVDKNFGDRPQLAYALKKLLSHLQDLDIPENEMWQGDYLFDDKILITKRNKFEFKPNIILYSVSKSNSEYTKIENTDLGIVWHTIYKNTSKPTFTEFNVNNIKGMYSTTSYIFTNEIRNIFMLENELNSIEFFLKILRSDKYNELTAYKTFNRLFQQYHNKMIKDGEKLYFDKFVKNFTEFVKSKESLGISEKIHRMCIDYEKELRIIFFLIFLISNIKEMLIEKLNDYSKYKSYIEYKYKNKPIKQEGFVFSTPDIVVKIVDRQEFSTLNFDNNIKRGWN